MAMTANTTETAHDAFAVTTDDNSDLPRIARGLYVGGAGDITLVTFRGTEVAFVGVSAGTILPVVARRVKATGTTATDVVGLV